MEGRPLEELCHDQTKNEKSGVTNKKTKQQIPEHHIRATKAIEKVLKTAGSNQKELRILVTGKTGQGKSALINGILGAKVSEEGAGGQRCTTEVTMHAKAIEGVPVKVFDSPGLQDRTKNEAEYIEKMRQKCKELSLVLYCTKMINTRLTDDDKNAMKKLTDAFGQDFWDYTVFVLTFANMEDVERRDDRDQDKEEDEPHDGDEKGWKELKKKRFQGRVDIWRKDLRDFLHKEVGVDRKIVDDIPLVPTGDRKITRNNKEPFHLPDSNNWFVKYWEVCCLRVKHTRLFMEISANRILNDDSSDDSSEEEDEDEEFSVSPKERFKAAMQKFIEIEKQAQLTNNASNPSKVPEEEEEETILCASKQRSISITSNTEDNNEKELSLNEEQIFIRSKLVENITAEAIRREGFEESFIKATKSVVGGMTKPGDWFTKLFRTKKRQDNTN